jgi:hypothetical protein
MSLSDTIHESAEGRDYRLATCVFLTICFIFVFQFLNKVGQIDSFIIIHWTWDYSFGFMKRALPGAMLETFLGPSRKKYHTILVLSTCMLTALLLSYAFFASSIIRHRPCVVPIGIAASGALLEPAIPYFIRSIGRPEQINFIFLLFSCYAVINYELRYSCLVLAVLCSLAMLIHEGFLFFHFPTALGVLAMRLATVHSHCPWQRSAILAATACPPIISFTLVWLFGSPIISEAEWDAYWISQTPFALNEVDNSLEIHYRGIMDNIKYTFAHLWPVTVLISFMVIGSASLLAKAVWFDWNTRKRSLTTLICFITAYTPMAMYFLGTDYLRWSSFVVINLVIISLCLVRLSPADSFDQFSNGIWPVPALQATMCGLAYLFLMFPQASGTGPARLPESFGCMYAIPGIERTYPEHPETCLITSGK